MGSASLARSPADVLLPTAAPRAKVGERGGGVALIWSDAPKRIRQCLTEYTQQFLAVGWLPPATVHGGVDVYVSCVSAVVIFVAAG